MGRAAGSITAIALGMLVGFVLRGLLEAPSAPDLPVPSGERGEVSSVPAATLSTRAQGSGGEGDAADRMRRQIERLHAELASEAALRDELQEELERLRRQLSTAAATDSRVETDLASGESRAGTGGPFAHMPWLDEKLLLEAGLRPSDIDALRERFEEIEMERLYLRDEATREGWLNTPRYRKALRELDLSFSALRGEFGDEAYDWLLYAAGRKNRVVVGGVLESSPASAAGIQPGDLVFSYDGVRIFAREELAAATSQGEPGRLVVLAVDRPDGLERFYVPRGPLGIRLGFQRVKPQVGR